MNVPGYRFHALSGDLKGFYSVRVSGNYRIIFRFEDKNATDIDYTDYHQISKDMAMLNPAHPGELIRETIEGIREETSEKLPIREVAEGLGVSRKTLDAILNGRQSVTPSMALRLEKAFPNTDAAFWLRAQENYDLAQARLTFEPKGIRQFWQPSI